MGYAEITYCSLKNRVYSIPSRRVEAVKVLSVSFLQDTDLVQAGFNDRIAFAEDGSTNILTATIPRGTYTIANFPDAVATSMSSAGTQPYTVKYNDITRRLTISTTGTKPFKILEGQRGTTAFGLLGMSKRSETGPGTSFTLKNTCNLSGSYPLLLVSNLNVSGTRWLSDFNDSTDSNVLCSITPDSINDVVTWQNTNGEFLYCDETISALEFHLIDSQTMAEVSLNSPLTVVIALTDDIPDYSTRNTTDNIEEQNVGQEKVEAADSVNEEEPMQEQVSIPAETEPQPRPKQKMTPKQEANLRKATAVRAANLRAMKAEREKKLAKEEEERLLAAAERIRVRKAQEKKALAAERKAAREARKPRPTKAKAFKEVEEDEDDSESAPEPELAAAAKPKRSQPAEYVTVKFDSDVPYVNPYAAPYWR
ncbi:hypothetical protein HDU86_002352 [Geranomyces michiganensis]|nr:hypothetical protein HDU86_002352 [Geranomyces michiganensis]